MSIQKKIETIVIVITALICIIISILDFVGALDSLEWLAQRISVMTLLAVGLVALYLIIERNRKFKNLEDIILKSNNQILNKIVLDKQSKEIISSIDEIWNEAENYIQNLHDQTTINTVSGDHTILKKYL